MKKSHTYLSFQPRIQFALLGLMCLLGAFTPPRFETTPAHTSTTIIADTKDKLSVDKKRVEDTYGVCTASGNVLMEAWLDIGNSHSIGDIPLSETPSYTRLLSQFEIPVNAHERYGVRIRGYLCPPVTGNYTFWISSDDSGELWVSRDRSPENKQRIAHVPGWTRSRVWDKYTEQKSQTVYLHAGESYYIEALMKEGEGGDNLAVRWRKPDKSYDEPIPGTYLSPYVEPKGEVCIPGGESTYQFQNHFGSGVGGLTYIDDAFFGTRASRYAKGMHQENVGPRGGASLGILLGGIDNRDVLGMSGAWAHTFTLEEASEIELEFNYKIIQAANYESDEYSQVLFSLDGREFPLATLTGDGNGGTVNLLDWQKEKRGLGVLSKGTHTLAFGGYSNKKTYRDEETYIYFDDLKIDARSTDNMAPVAAFTLTQQQGKSVAEVLVDASSSEDSEGDELSYSWDFGEGTSKGGRRVRHEFEEPGIYTITLVVTDSKGCTSELSKSITVGKAALGLSSACVATGNILMESWLDIGDSHNVGDIPTDNIPSSVQLLTQFEIPVNVHERYGVRVRGYICPPMTGEYTFWISSDDNGELWLSTDQNPANKERIAHVPGWTSSRLWTKYPEQESRSIYLEAGKSYYVEALMKEGIGGDNLAVKWRMPDNREEEPIPGTYLSPYTENTVPNQDDITRYSQGQGEVCSPGGESLYQVQENFETGVGSFSYSDDSFFGTQAPRYARGRWQQNVGPSGGSSLGIFLGGRDNVAIYGMSGAWTHTFYLEEAAEVDLSFWYAMVQASNFESDEYSQVVFSLDGNAYPLATLTGDGNGGNNQYVSWQEEARSLGELSAGRHTLSFGGYLNKKTYNDEEANVYFDLIEITAKSLSNVAPVADFDLSQQTDQEAVTVKVDGSKTTDLEGDQLTYSWNFGEGTTKSGEQVSHAYTASGTYEITLTVADSKGCTSQTRKSLIVDIPTPPGVPPIEVEVTPIQPSECGAVGSVQVTTNRGNVRITKDGELVEDYNSLSPGTYNWEVIDGDEGKSGSFTINERYELPIITQTSTTDASCDEADGTIKIAFENNTNRTDISFSVDGGQSYPLKVPVSAGNAQFTGMAAGTYEVWARWGNGECATYVGSVEIESSEAPTVSIDPAGPFEETANPYRLVANPAGGTWSGPVSADGTFDPSIGEGIYQVGYRYTDENGCIGQASINLEVLPSTSTCRARITQIGPLTPDQRIIQLEATPAGGTWAGDVTPGGSFDPSCPGVYTVSYTYSDGADCSTTDTSTIWVQSTVKDIIIVAGQSNAVGANNTPNVLTLDPDPIDEYIDYSWNIPEEFLQNGWAKMQLIPAQGNRFSHGAEVSLSRELFNSGYNNLGVIKVAKGGTNLDQDWNPNTSEQGYDGNGGGMYPEMVNFVKARLSELESQGITYRVSGFFWHQGEGDMTAYRAPRYESNLINFIAKVREEFGANLPFFIAKVYNPNATAGEQEAVQLAQQSVASVDPNAFFIDLDQIYFDPNKSPNQGNLISDLLHYNSAGLVRVGEKFSNTYRSNFPIIGCNEDLGNLCETSINLALGKPTAQSSTYGQGISGLAVDGEQEGSSPWTADLAHTEVEFQPWWEVDLGVVANVEQVRIYNRTDCCFGRLNNFSIFVSNDPFPADASLTSLRNDPSISFVTFSGSAGLTEFINIEASGRYVRIQHSREIQLHMAEVEVWGCSQATQASRFNGVAEAIGVDEEQSGIRVFPNPTQNVLIIQTAEKNVNKLVEISLYNLAGQIVQQVRGVEGYTSLNVSNLARGMYALQVKGEDWTHIQKVSLE